VASISEPARGPIFLPGSSSGTGRGIGVLILHGFLGSPVSIAPWAHGIHQSGFTVSAPVLAGHGSNWQDLEDTEWRDWYQSAETAFLELKASCDRIFVAGFSMGGALALRLAEIRGSEIEGVILLNPSIGDKRWRFSLVPLLKYLMPSIKNGPSDIAKPGAPIHIYPRTPLKALDSLRALWKRVVPDLYLVDLPLMIAYSENDHTVDPEWSQLIIDSVYSPTVRELVFEKSFHNVALDYDSEELIAESVEFIHDVLSGELEQMGIDDEEDLINAEFESIVSGLNLDQSTGSTYLDELDRFDEITEADRFREPNPPIAPTDRLGKLAIAGIVGGPSYLLLEYVTGFNLLGFGPWPGVLAFIAGIATAIYKFTLPDSNSGDGFDDGAVL
jgi:carboxylesterase